MAKILTREQYDWAVARVEQLLPLVDDNTPTSDPASIELEILSNLVADYSDEHFAIGEPDLVSVIRERMFEDGLSQKDLAERLGVSPSRVSEYLNGKKQPTLTVARKIHEVLHIDAGIILGVA
ncbi:MAG: helix-turn-helix domain-containing protein [Bacteroidales bacterium]|nr:helix-turn-helix domain-containing protein [Bacteroidales bacterium]